MPTGDSRPPLTRETLAALLHASGIPLEPEDIDGLLAPTAATYRAIDGLDGLDLADAEPAAHFHFPLE